jgi:hypothetical protein
LDKIQTEEVLDFSSLLFTVTSTNKLYSPPSVFLDLRFLQICIEISTATAGGGGGSVYVNKYLDQRRVRHSQANKFFLRILVRFEL